MGGVGNRMSRLAPREVRQLRKAGVAVPENILEVERLLNEAERETEGIPLEQASREIRKRLKAKFAKKKSA